MADHLHCTAGNSDGDELVWVLDKHGGKQQVGVDPCIAGIVHALNAGGMPTVASCCGHGHRPGTVILRDGRELFVFATREEGRDAGKMFDVDIHGEKRTAE